jgi:hypothetical protein
MAFLNRDSELWRLDSNAMLLSNCSSPLLPILLNNESNVATRVLQTQYSARMRGLAVLPLSIDERQAGNTWKYEYVVVCFSFPCK